MRQHAHCELCSHVKHGVSSSPLLQQAAASHLESAAPVHLPLFSLPSNVCRLPVASRGGACRGIPPHPRVHCLCKWTAGSSIHFLHPPLPALVWRGTVDAESGGGKRRGWLHFRADHQGAPGRGAGGAAPRGRWAGHRSVGGRWHAPLPGGESPPHVRRWAAPRQAQKGKGEGRPCTPFFLARDHAARDCRLARQAGVAVASCKAEPPARLDPPAPLSTSLQRSCRCWRRLGSCRPLSSYTCVATATSPDAHAPPLAWQMSRASEVCTDLPLPYSPTPWTDVVPS